MNELMHVHVRVRVHVYLFKQLSQKKKENSKRMANIIQFRKSSIMITKSNVFSSFTFCLKFGCKVEIVPKMYLFSVQKVMQQHAVEQIHTIAGKDQQFIYFVISSANICVGVGSAFCSLV